MNYTLKSEENKLDAVLQILSPDAWTENNLAPSSVSPQESLPSVHDLSFLPSTVSTDGFKVKLLSSEGFVDRKEVLLASTITKRVFSKCQKLQLLPPHCYTREITLKDQSCHSTDCIVITQTFEEDDGVEEYSLHAEQQQQQKNCEKQRHLKNGLSQSQPFTRHTVFDVPVYFREQKVLQHDEDFKLHSDEDCNLQRDKDFELQPDEDFRLKSEMGTNREIIFCTESFFHQEGNDEAASCPRVGTRQCELHAGKQPFLYKLPEVRQTEIITSSATSAGALNPLANKDDDTVQYGTRTALTADIMNDATVVPHTPNRCCSKPAGMSLKTFVNGTEMHQPSIITYVGSAVQRHTENQQVLQHQCLLREIALKDQRGHVIECIIIKQNLEDSRPDDSTFSAEFQQANSPEELQLKSTKRWTRLHLLTGKTTSCCHIDCREHCGHQHNEEFTSFKQVPSVEIETDVAFPTQTFSDQLNDSNTTVLSGSVSAKRHNVVTVNRTSGDRLTDIAKAEISSVSTTTIDDTNSLTSNTETGSLDTTSSSTIFTPNFITNPVTMTWVKTKRRNVNDLCSLNISTVPSVSHSDTRKERVLDVGTMRYNIMSDDNSPTRCIMNNYHTREEWVDSRAAVSEIEDTSCADAVIHGMKTHTDNFINMCPVSTNVIKPIENMNTCPISTDVIKPIENTNEDSMSINTITDDRKNTGRISADTTNINTLSTDSEYKFVIIDAVMRPDTVNLHTTIPSPVTVNPNTMIPDTLNANTTIPDALNANTTIPDTLNANTTSSDTLNANTTSSDTLNANTTSSHTLNANTTSSHTLNANTTSSHTLNANTTIPDTLNANTTIPDTLNANTTIPDTLNANTMSSHTLNANTTIPDTLNANTTSSHTLNANTTSSHTLNANTTSSDTLNANTTIPNTLNANTTIPDTLNANATSSDTLNENTTSPEPCIPDIMSPFVQNTTGPDTLNPNSTSPDSFIPNTLSLFVQTTTNQDTGNSDIARLGVNRGVTFSSDALNPSILNLNVISSNTSSTDALNDGASSAGIVSKNMVVSPFKNSDQLSSDIIINHTFSKCMYRTNADTFFTDTQSPSNINACAITSYTKSDDARIAHTINNDFSNDDTTSQSKWSENQGTFEDFPNVCSGDDLLDRKLPQSDFKSMNRAQSLTENVSAPRCFDGHSPLFTKHNIVLVEHHGHVQQDPGSDKYGRRQCQKYGQLRCLSKVISQRTNPDSSGMPQNGSSCASDVMTFTDYNNFYDMSLTVEQPINEKQMFLAVEQPINEKQMFLTAEQPIKEKQMFLTAEQPIDEKQMSLTGEQPIDEKQMSLTGEQPINEMQMSLTEEQPINETQLSLTEEQPINKKQRSLTVEQPINEKHVSLTAEQPINEKKRSLSVAQPFNEKHTSVSGGQPINNKLMSLSGEQPINNKHVSLSEGQPINNKNSLQDPIDTGKSPTEAIYESPTIKKDTLVPHIPIFHALDIGIQQWLRTSRHSSSVTQLETGQELCISPSNKPARKLKRPRICWRSQHLAPDRDNHISRAKLNSIIPFSRFPDTIAGVQSGLSPSITSPRARRPVQVLSPFEKDCTSLQYMRGKTGKQTKDIGKIENTKEGLLSTVIPQESVLPVIRNRIDFTCKQKRQSWKNKIHRNQNQEKRLMPRFEIHSQNKKCASLQSVVPKSLMKQKMAMKLDLSESGEITTSRYNRRTLRSVPKSWYFKQTSQVTHDLTHTNKMSLPVETLVKKDCLLLEQSSMSKVTTTPLVSGRALLLGSTSDINITTANHNNIRISEKKGKTESPFTALDEMKESEREKNSFNQTTNYNAFEFISVDLQAKRHSQVTKIYPTKDLPDSDLIANATYTSKVKIFNVNNAGSSFNNDGQFLETVKDGNGSNRTIRTRVADVTSDFPVNKSSHSGALMPAAKSIEHQLITGHSRCGHSTVECGQFPSMLSSMMKGPARVFSFRAPNLVLQNCRHGAYSNDKRCGYAKGVREPGSKSCDRSACNTTYNTSSSDSLSSILHDSTLYGTCPLNKTSPNTSLLDAPSHSTQLSTPVCAPLITSPRNTTPSRSQHNTLLNTSPLNTSPSTSLPNKSSMIPFNMSRSTSQINILSCTPLSNTSCVSPLITLPSVSPLNTSSITTPLNASPSTSSLNTSQSTSPLSTSSSTTPFNMSSFDTPSSMSMNSTLPNITSSSTLSSMSSYSISPDTSLCYISPSTSLHNISHSTSYNILPNTSLYNTSFGTSPYNTSPSTLQFDASPNTSLYSPSPSTSLYNLPPSTPLYNTSSNMSLFNTSSTSPLSTPSCAFSRPNCIYSKEEALENMRDNVRGKRLFKGKQSHHTSVLLRLLYPKPSIPSASSQATAHDDQNSTPPLESRNRCHEDRVQSGQDARAARVPVVVPSFENDKLCFQCSLKRQGCSQKPVVIVQPLPHIAVSNFKLQPSLVSGDTFVPIAIPPDGKRSGAQGTEEAERTMEYLPPAKRRHLPNPYNRFNQRCHSTLHCPCFFFVCFLCCAAAVYSMDRSDYEFDHGSLAAARLYGRRAKVLYVVGPVIAVALLMVAITTAAIFLQETL